MAARILVCPRALGIPANKCHVQQETREVGLFPEPGVESHGPVWTVYPEDVAYVNAIVASLEGDSAEWATQLHDEEPPKLVNLDTFLDEFWA